MYSFIVLKDKEMRDMFGILIYWFYHRLGTAAEIRRKSNDDNGYLSFYCGWEWVPKRNSVKSHNQTSQVSSQNYFIGHITNCVTD